MTFQMSANTGLLYSAMGEVGGGGRCRNLAVEKLLFPDAANTISGEDRAVERWHFAFLRLGALGNGDGEFSPSCSLSGTFEMM